MKRFMKSMTLCMLVLCMLVVMKPTTGEAAKKKPKCRAQMTIKYYDSFDGMYWIDQKTSNCLLKIKNLKSGAKIKKIKSGILKGFDARKAAKGRTKGIYLDTFKKGAQPADGMQIPVSFVVKQNGKKYKLSCLVTLKYMGRR